MKKKNIYTVGLLLLSFISFSQQKDTKLSKGDDLFEKRAYFKSIEVYEKVADKGYKSVELFQKLGDSYFFNGDYVKANKWYSQLFGLSKDIAPIYYYRYSQTLKTVGDTKNADSYLAQFAALNSTDSRSQHYLEDRDYLSKIEDKSLVYKIEDAGVNTSYSDYGTAIYQNKVIFTSSRVPDNKVKKDDWTSEYYSSLYTASLDKDNKLVDQQVFAKEVQTQYHESDPVFTKDGKTMYFTRSSVAKNKKKGDRSFLLKIYKASFIDGKWDNIKALEFNSDAYNCAHPALSPDEKMLYFVSDMPGGYGDTDLYKLPISGEMKSSNVVNLGSVVNTAGKETFPWIDQSNELYFASDGHLGLGGLDLFVTKIQNSEVIDKVVNLGKPINSEFDDFGFVKLDDLKVGFFTSNREGGQGKDDIYRFTEEESLPGVISGLVIDDETKEILANAKVAIYDNSHDLIANTITDSSGRFKVDLQNKLVKGNLYARADKENYESKEIIVSSKDVKSDIIIGLVNPIKVIGSGSDLAIMLNIKDIKFDLDKFNIRPDAEVELQKVLQVLNQFPEIKIAIGSHTDARHTNSYNLILSQKRANSTRAYLISKGISSERLTAKGYGETKLINKCSNGVECTEEEHQVNRRSEFVVIKN